MLNFDKKQVYKDKLSLLSDTEKKILKIMAYTMKEMDEDNFRAIAKKQGMDTKAVELLKNKLLRSTLISIASGYYFHPEFKLQPVVQILLLMEIAGEKSHKEYGRYLTNSRNSLLKELYHNRDTFFRFVKGERDGLKFYDDHCISETTGFLFSIVWFEELRGIERLLPMQMLYYFWTSIYEAIANLRPVSMDWVDDVYNHFNDQCHGQVFDSVFNTNLIIKHVLCGDLNEAFRYAIKGSHGSYITALYHQQKGDVAKALKSYKEGIEIESAYGKVDYPVDLLFFFYYVLALMVDGSDRSKKKIANIKNDMEPHYSGIESVKLLLEIASVKDPSHVSSIRDINEKRFLYPLDSVLEAILRKHYNLSPAKDDAEMVINAISDERFGLFQMEASSCINPFKENRSKISDRFGIKPMLPPYKFEEPWLRVLNSMLGKGKNNGRMPVVEDKNSSGDRFVYMIDSYDNILPRLQKAKANGGWTKGRAVSLSGFRNGMDEMSMLDRDISKLVTESHERSMYGYPQTVLKLRSSRAFQKLIGHQNVYLEANPDVRMDVMEEKPFIAIKKERKQFIIESNVENVGERNLCYHYYENNTRIKVVQMTSRQKDIIAALESVPAYPIESESLISELIARLSGEITIHSDLIASSKDVVQVKGDPSVVIQMLPIGDGFKAEMFVKPFSTEPPYCKAGSGTQNVLGKVDGKSAQASRDFKKEKKEFDSVCSSLDRFSFEEPGKLGLDDIEQGLDFLESVRALGEKARIEWPEGVKLKIRNQATMGNLSVKLKSNINWFEMEGELKVGDDVAMSLAELMQSLQRPDQKFITLGNDEFLALSDELRHLLNRLKAIGVKDKNKLRISEFAAPGISDMAENGVNMKTDATFKKLKKRVDEASSRQYDIPSNLKAELRDYQQVGFKWMARLSDWGAGACLADDMGLGKTLQSIAMLLHKAEGGASMVVAPASVITNWQNEINRFAPSLSTRILNYESDRDAAIRSAGEFDVILTTYGLLVTHESDFAQKQWNMIVLDEAHTIKNRDTKMSKSAMQLKGAFRLILTGTPVQNHLSEIWNLFQFMNPGLLGSYEHFQKNFINPIEQNRDLAQQNELKRLIAPFMLRRTKNEVLQELPGKTEIVLPVIMSDKERVLYESLRMKAQSMLETGDLNAVQTLAEITRLRQVASHPALVDKSFGEESSKLNSFFELLDGIIENSHRCLVFSQFTSHLSLMREALEKRGVEYLYLDGSTPTAQREKLVKKFQTGSQPLFLISLKAGGLGLNLTAADIIVHLDPWWNPAIEDQASDRAYRIGQKRPVTVYRLISQNTIEEKIIRLHATKKDLADSLLEGSNMSHKLTREEMLSLLDSNY